MLDLVSQLDLEGALDAALESAAVIALIAVAGWVAWTYVDAREWLQGIFAAIECFA